VRAQLELVLMAVSNMPTEELAKLIGELEECKAMALQRLCTLPPQAAPVPVDELLDIEAASAKLGMSRDYLYRHEFPFTRRMGRSLRFSARGIEAYIQKKQ
jgi:predicted DNA-binding transcriptional regulator AlpA